MIPSSAAIVSSAKSMPLAPASIVCTKRSWPGTSMKPRTAPVRRRQIGKAEIDRDAARLLFLQPVAVDAGQRFDQRRLAVIDVAGRADDHRFIGCVARSRIGPGRCGRVYSEQKKCRFIGQAAQIENERAVVDLADDRARTGRAARLRDARARCHRRST